MFSVIYLINEFIYNLYYEYCLGIVDSIQQ